jgi:DNA-binding NtrC family response regulator
MDKPIILIAVDDEGIRRSIAELPHGQRYDVLDAAGRSEVMACVYERASDLVIVGSFRDATWDALEVVREVRKIDRLLPVMDSIHQPPARREEDICVISPS